MRRTRLFRGLASILSVWLAICLAEPAQLHTCAMHGGLAIDVSMQSAGLHGESAHGAHAGIASTHSMAGHSHHDQDTDGQSRQCTCLGDCSTGKTPVGLAAAQTQLVALQIEGSGAIFTYVSPSLASPHFFLPFSNGPPIASSHA